MPVIGSNPLIWKNVDLRVCTREAVGIFKWSLTSHIRSVEDSNAQCNLIFWDLAQKFSEENNISIWPAGQYFDILEKK